ncbi:DegQ family serine endoprotease [Kaarinaea lacus]
MKGSSVGNDLQKVRWILILLTLLLQSVASAALPVQDGSGRELPSLAPMLKQVNPAVVNISTYATQETYNPLLNDPFFRFFFDIPENYQQRKQQRQQSAGSGVIVDAKEGVVITNFHVIKGADEVHVSLTDGRNFKAKVIGEDPDLDVAVLKIKPDRLLEVSLADSNTLEVGDFVVAIGNPFGLGQTVTTGIVSALGRTGLGIEGYENFIQTDASINPGNSGGALVNLRGELVGINTAIIAPSGGNVGIGFAIPINMVKSSMEQILKHGEVRRGYMGINIQDITPDLRQAFNLPNGQRGVLITGIDDGSPADEAGIKAGDIVTSIAGESTTSTGQLRSQIAVKSVGDTVEIGIIRDTKEKRIKVKIAAPEKTVADIRSKYSKLLEGAQFEDHRGGKGVVVSQIAPNSNAAYSGLRQGDIIMGVNRQRVTDMKSFRKALKSDSEKLLIHINRNGRAFYLVIS